MKNETRRKIISLAQNCVGKAYRNGQWSGSKSPLATQYYNEDIQAWKEFVDFMNAL